MEHDIPSRDTNEIGLRTSASLVAPPARPGGDGQQDAPRPVIRGESFIPLGESALTDWLNVTFPVPGGADPLRTIFDSLSDATAAAFGGMSNRDRGLHGYAKSYVFDRGGVLLGIGGQRETVFLSIPGDGCALVRDWPKLAGLLRDDLLGRITRWDGAKDDFSGSHSVDLAVELWHLGGFSTGGNRPQINQAGNWIAPDGRGRTLYVGKREHGKLARIYEKGMQLGAPFHPWVRWEIELHNIDRHIPWDVLIEPGTFVAGAYPCMSWVHERSSRIRTTKAQHEISLERLTQCGSIAYGALINVLLTTEGSAEKVVEKLRRMRVPRRLTGTNDALRVYGDPSAI